MDHSHNALDIHPPNIPPFASPPYHHPSVQDYPSALPPLQQQQQHDMIQHHQQHQQQQQQQPLVGPADQLSPPTGAPPRPLTAHEEDMLAHLDRLKFFLATAPSRWASSGASAPSDPHFSHANADPSAPSPPPVPHPALNRFLLPSGEYVSCVLWNGLYHITGTDIVRALVFRFDAFGRPVRNMKKFEEGVFSDLRNLKPGTDACLEEPKSPFLDLLFKYQCIRTQKKQKVFYWFSVPHDRLFLDALERDLKREKMGLEPTTHIVGEPARSFTYDPKRSLFEQFSKARGGIEGEGELERAVREIGEVGSVMLPDGSVATSVDQLGTKDFSSGVPASLASPPTAQEEEQQTQDQADPDQPQQQGGGPRGTQFFSMFSLFEGSPTYKMRRKKGSAAPPTTTVSTMVGGKAAPTSALATADVITSSSLSSSATKVDQYDGPAGYDGNDVYVGHPYAPSYVAEPEDYGPPPPLAYGSAPAAYNPAPNPTTANPAASNVGLGLGLVGYVPPPQQQQPGSRLASPYPQQQPRSMLTHSAPYHLSPSPAPHGYDPQPMQHHHLSPAPQIYSPYGTPDLEIPPANAGTSAGSTSSLKPKSFTCPLLSCCRTFKRMEHLKRHVRTHTMEKPYECEKCGKKFSRSDNLTQHLRTHGRDGAGAIDKVEGSSGSASNSGGEGSPGGSEVGIGMGLGEIDLEQERRDSIVSVHGGASVEGTMGVPMAVFTTEPSHYEGSPASFVEPLRPGSAYDTWAPHAQADAFHPQHSQSLPVTLPDAAYPGMHPLGDLDAASSFAGSPPQQHHPLLPLPQHMVPRRRPGPPMHAHTTDMGGYTRGVSLQPLGVTKFHAAKMHVSASHQDLAHLYQQQQQTDYAGGLSVGPIRRHRSATPTIRQMASLPHFNHHAVAATSPSGSKGYHPYLSQGHAASRSRDFSGSDYGGGAATGDYLQAPPPMATTLSQSHSSQQHDEYAAVSAAVDGLYGLDASPDATTNGAAGYPTGLVTSPPPPQIGV